MNASTIPPPRVPRPLTHLRRARSIPARVMVNGSRGTGAPKVKQYAMRLELQGGQWRSAASIAEKAAPYVHPKMAPRAEEGGDHELTIKIIGGLPE
jgi:hypothetical protein